MLDHWSHQLPVTIIIFEGVNICALPFFVQILGGDKGLCTCTLYSVRANIISNFYFFNQRRGVALGFGFLSHQVPPAVNLHIKKELKKELWWVDIYPIMALD